MNKKIIIFLSIVILIITIIVFLIFINNKTGSSESKLLPVEYENESQNEMENIIEESDTQEKIINMIENQGFSANEDIYELAQEYDGRETIVIKASVQYKVALAGMIKQAVPDFNEINNLLEKAPTHTGVWVEENSRSEFLEILKNITNGNYNIDENGFLIKNQVLFPNNYDKIIIDMIDDGGLYIFDISSITYLVDEVTGEIKEYPFEDMDPNQEYEYFESDNKYMFIISENIQEKINKQEALKKILENK